MNGQPARERKRFPPQAGQLWYDSGPTSRFEAQARQDRPESLGQRHLVEINNQMPER